MTLYGQTFDQEYWEKAAIYEAMSRHRLRVPCSHQKSLFHRRLTAFGCSACLPVD